MRAKIWNFTYENKLATTSQPASQRIVARQTVVDATRADAVMVNFGFHSCVVQSGIGYARAPNLYIPNIVFNYVKFVPD